MFTGLIEKVGRLADIRSRGNYRLLRISSELPHDEISVGESIACDGSCLTVTGLDKSSFSVEASQETLARTTLSDYRAGCLINLERAMRLGDRLGGHFVSGHIDTVGTVDRIQKLGESLVLWISYDKTHSALVIEKGSIAINGISLTVNQCQSGQFSVNLIPHTVVNTNIPGLKSGHKVNLEFDLLGKYVINMLEKNSSHNLTMDKLRESGF